MLSSNNIVESEKNANLIDDLECDVENNRAQVFSDRGSLLGSGGAARNRGLTRLTNSVGGQMAF